MATKSFTSKSFAPADLPQLLNRPGVLLVDVRPRRLFHRDHVPGSHSIPAGLLLAGELPEGELLLIGGDSSSSEALIEQLHGQGYARRVRYLRGGFPAWRAGQSEAEEARAGEAPRPDWPRLLDRGRQLLAGPVFSRSRA